MNDKSFSSWEDAVRWLIAQPDQQALVQDCYFDRPALAAAHRYHQSDEWNAVRTLLPTHPGSVLDVGAGMGITSYALALDGWQTTALEPDPNPLVGAEAIRQLAEEAKLKITVVETWGETLPFADASFELIHARQVLHHAHDLRQFCVESYRVLKPGGRLVATREHVISHPNHLQKFLENHPLQQLYGGEHALQRSEYENCLTAAGFAIRKILGPWDSVINYAPFNRHKLKKLFHDRFISWPGASGFAQLAFSDLGFLVIRRILAMLDQRPGRLYTFVAEKLDYES